MEPCWRRRVQSGEPQIPPGGPWPFFQLCQRGSREGVRCLHHSRTYFWCLTSFGQGLNLWCWESFWFWVRHWHALGDKDFLCLMLIPEKHLGLLCSLLMGMFLSSHDWNSGLVSIHSLFSREGPQITIPSSSLRAYDFAWNANNIMCVASPEGKLFFSAVKINLVW